MNRLFRWITLAALPALVFFALPPRQVEIQNLTLTIPAAQYEIRDEPEGAAIHMQDYGALMKEGWPQLPSRVFLIAVPPGAQIRDVRLTPARGVALPGAYTVQPVKPSFSGALSSQELADRLSDWRTESARAYENTAPYPTQTGVYLGQDQWRKYTYARIEFRPFKYQANTGLLTYYPSLQVSIDFTTPDPASPSGKKVAATLSDQVMDDLAAETLYNFPQAQTWYAPETAPAAPTADKFDYVIIVPNNDMVAAVTPLATWKEQLGFSVKVETLPTIYAAYSGDNASRIWQYLHDRYLYNEWGIRYVLLIGDVDTIPMRLLYPNGDALDGGAYSSDYYYARLNVADWDVDNDNRWGEFTQDNLSSTPDVIVGRIPFSAAQEVSAVINNILAFEQDTEVWKRNALLANGALDYNSTTDKTDTAVLAERLKTDFYDPYGWTYTTLYETGGLAPTTYTPDLPFSQANYDSVLSPTVHSLVTINAHGNPVDMASMVWSVDVNNNGVAEADPPLSELTANRISNQANVASHPTSGVVFLNGCSTGPINGDDPNFAASPLRSLYIITATRQGMMLKEYLEHGSPAVIASTAGSDYTHAWNKPADGRSQSLNYYFIEQLIPKDKKVGDAFYAAMTDYVSKHGFVRGIRVFNFYGDPSLTLKGVANRPGGADTLVKEGKYQTYAGDNADNGDMYVAVLTTNYVTKPGVISIYKSSDHGASWHSWAVYTEDVAKQEGIMDVDVLVGDYSKNDTPDPRLHIIYSTPNGKVYDLRIDLNNPANRDLRTVFSDGVYASNVSIARDPGAMPGDYNLYLAWGFEKDGTLYVKSARSTDNGASWTVTYTLADRLMPDIDTGADGMVYLTMLERNDAMDVHAVRSADYGQNWGSDADLTSGDGAQAHTAPAIAASTDAALPAVWVVYNYEYQSDTWGYSRDLLFAYSSDSGTNWTKGLNMSADQGVDEWMPDMVGSRLSPNRWMNVAFNYDPFPNNGYRRNVIWRWTSGGLPNFWWAPRIINDRKAAAPYANRPVVIYSPGVTQTGSGVVYGAGDRSNIYFSAPWLTTAAQASVNLPANLAAHLAAPQAILPASNAPIPAASGLPPLTWEAAGDLSGAFSISALYASTSGALYASGVWNPEADRNEGAVYRSSNGGQTWEQLASPANSWSLTSIVQAADGSLLAGGIKLEGAQAYGVIYRSPDDGANWTPAFSFPGGAVYDLLRAANNHLFAVTGWQGDIYRSTDNGANWSSAGHLGDGIQINTILQDSEGTLFVGVEAPESGRVYRSTTDGDSWTQTGALNGAESIHDLIQSGDYLYAAAHTAEKGLVYRADLQGAAWTALPDLDTDIPAVTALLDGPLGKVFAGVASKSGESATRIYGISNSSSAWEPVGGPLDLAGTVHAFTLSGDAAIAATGDLYGNVYQCSLTPYHIHLPLIPYQ